MQLQMLGLPESPTVDATPACPGCCARKEKGNKGAAPAGSEQPRAKREVRLEVQPQLVHLPARWDLGLLRAPRSATPSEIRGVTAAGLRHGGDLQLPGPGWRSRLPSHVLMTAASPGRERGPFLVTGAAVSPRGCPAGLWIKETKTKRRR